VLGGATVTKPTALGLLGPESYTPNSIGRMLVSKTSDLGSSHEVYAERKIDMNTLQFESETDNMSYIPGEPHLTVSGRETSPAPKLWKGEPTERKASAFLARESKWLATEGNAERAYRGLLSSIYDGQNLSDADRIEINHYLSDPEWLDIHK
jgi:hypothetical protein